MKRLLLCTTLALFSQIPASWAISRLPYHLQMDAMLQRASQQLVENEEADRSRLALSLALALTGNFNRSRDLLKAIKDPQMRSQAWAELGKAQEDGYHETEAARNSFSEALREAQQLKDLSARHSQSLNIISKHALSGDHEGAAKLAHSLEPVIRFRALASVAELTAYRYGNRELANSLLTLAQTPDEKSRAYRVISTNNAKGHHIPEAKAALAQVTDPRHRLAPLLMLDTLVLDDPQYLKQALDIVAKLPKGDLVRDGSMGAIAWQYYRRTQNLPQTLNALRLLKNTDSAESYILRLCRELARQGKVQEAHAIVDLSHMSPLMQIKSLGIIIDALAEQHDWAVNPKYRHDQKAAQLSKQLLAAFLQASDILETMTDNYDHDQALAVIVKSLARTHQYAEALKWSAKARQRDHQALSLSGLTLASLEQSEPQQLKISLELFEKAARQQVSTNLTAQILGQGVTEILTPYMRLETRSLGDIAVGIYQENIGF